jgi:hypothetical protein
MNKEINELREKFKNTTLMDMLCLKMTIILLNIQK